MTELEKQMLAVLKECDEAMAYMSEYDIPLTLPDRVKEAIAAAEAAQAAAVPEGFVLVQRSPGKAVCLDGGRFHGWLMYRHPDGQFVSERKLQPWEVKEAATRLAAKAKGGEV
ncbi:hypothetical protein [Chromobacterium haemolyticum]|uniref:hypothetical protein n=1 Tax=Chromobacterium haemolyticum TaxID=394935 RepID=UPI0005B7E3AD|nr:hypothetical protein [Chromobacterium haemolyticum]